MTRIDTQLVECAVSQQGLVRRCQLAELGASPKVIARWRRSGLLWPVTAEVFALAGAVLTPEQRERAALWQAGPVAALSHASAAVRWAFPHVAPGATEVVVPHGTSIPRFTIGRVHVSRRLRPTDVTSLGGWPVTSPERTIIDLAARLGASHLAECVADLRRRQVLDLELFRRSLEGDLRPRVAGIGRVDHIVDALTARPAGESWLEDRFIEVLQEAGRRLPDMQAWIAVDGHRYRVDGLWSPELLVVELDGHQFHSTRPDRRADAERGARLTGAGYGLVRFTYDDVVERPAYVLEVIDHHLAQRAPT